LLKGHDKLTDSRIIEAESLQEEQHIFKQQIEIDNTYVEYSAAALVNLNSVQFIDDSPVTTSQITSSNPAHMPLRQAGYQEYNFTEQETKYV
jgi:hypothetical protein